MAKRNRTLAGASLTLQEIEPLTRNQVKAFDDALGITGLILTKLDGTAKGGVIAAIAMQRQQNPIPLYFIGAGEGIEDLQPFDARKFVEALFD